MAVAIRLVGEDEGSDHEAVVGGVGSEPCSEGDCKGVEIRGDVYGNGRGVGHYLVMAVMAGWIVYSAIGNWLTAFEFAPCLIPHSCMTQHF